MNYEKLIDAIETINAVVSEQCSLNGNSCKNCRLWRLCSENVGQESALELINDTAEVLKC